MRIVKFIFQSFFSIIITVLVVAAVVREGFLFWGTQVIRSGVYRMDVVSRNIDSWVRECRREGGGEHIGGGVRGVQMRFTSEKEFQVEVVCEYFSSVPQVVEEYQLPMFVKKYPGSSGYYWKGGGESAITLEASVLNLLSRRSTLILTDDRLKIVQGIQSFDTPQPPTICEGYGYQCCDAITQVGEGDLTSSALNCPNNCFPKCSKRPYVVRFHSDPSPDIENRLVEITSGSQVDFYYVIDPGEYAADYSVVVDFGDGQNQAFLAKETTTSHTYTCAQGPCVYTAKVTISDRNGLKSIDTPISNITIRMP